MEALAFGGLYRFVEEKSVWHAARSTSFAVGSWWLNETILIMKKWIQLASVTAVASAVVTSLNAAPVSLSSLVDGGSITIGDKIFADFGFASAQFRVTDASVEAKIDGRGVYHLLFTGPFLSVGSTPSDVSLRYSVATTTGLPLIMGIDQSFQLSSSGTGGFVLIGETVRSDSFVGPAVAQSSLTYVAGSPDLNDFEDPISEPLTGDQLIINPTLSKVYVTKDVFMMGLPGGTVGPTVLNQSFHQIPTNVPEAGSTAALLGVGLGIVTLVGHSMAGKRR
jgi:hypothetical protein